MRLDEWKQRLFDLGKTNRLINYKETQKSSIDIALPAIDKIYHSLSSGRKLDFFDVDGWLREKQKHPTVQEKPQVPVTESIEKLMKASQILAFKDGFPTNPILHELVKRTKESLVERGINILFMAFGFLHWKETSNAHSALLSPLILVPVKITRESAITPYVIEEYEDETITNPTLLYKLQHEYSVSLSPIEEGQSVVEYLESVAQMVKPLDWTVTSEVRISLFSFLKMNMYLDLRDNETLILQNANVKTLLNPETPGAEIRPAVREKSDELLLHNVVNADSSQIEAILKAKANENFVLQGPPGTGKSQTITNIIAECMADGKKVLFVSEKMAALQVVYSNMKKVGLEDFCLELHSHKTNKKAVIDELARVMNQAKTTTNGKAFDEITELLRAKNQLDGYAEALHAHRPGIDATLFQLFGELATVESAPTVDFVIGDLRKKKKDYLANAVETLNRYLESSEVLGNDYRKNDWHGYVSFDSSYEHQSAVRGALLQIVPAMETFRTVLDELSEIHQSPLASIDDFQKIRELSGFIAQLTWHHPKVFMTNERSQILTTFENLGTMANEIHKNHSQLSEIFGEDFFRLDGKATWEELHGKYHFFLKRFSHQYRLFQGRILRMRKASDRPLGYRELVRLLGLWKDEQAAQTWFEEKKPIAQEILGEQFLGLDTDWARYVGDLKKLREYSEKGLALSGFSRYSPLEFHSMQPRYSLLLHRFSEAFGQNLSRLELIRANFDRQVFDVFPDEIHHALFKVRQCAEKGHLLEAWSRLLRILEEARKTEVLGYLHAFLDANHPPKDLAPAFRKLYFRQWAYAILEDEPLLRDFNRQYQDRCVQVFADKDRLQFDISNARIKEKLSSLRPDLNLVSAGSPVSVLLRETQKKRNLLPVRLLLKQIPELAQVLKPCFLMSPLSVSTYLDPQSIAFDVVIFDEASQIFPQDALGAIYRSKQVIVVGDTKQMPPSNFFTSTLSSDDSENEDFEENVQDFESILDISATRFVQNRLRWHYRSQTEELIAFSNAHYYDNSLLTFPSAKSKAEDFGVEFAFQPDGRFDRTTKTNLVEARFVTDLVISHFQKHPERSLGVVAFSVSQQEAIDDLLWKRREENPTLEAFFSEDRKEPFFVKNLETVQGDERDTILFSVAYGKDAAGIFHHHFGPLNQAGGERRLNVAVTRAKINVKVVSSIRSLDIDLAKSKSLGARFLKEYLDYAENGVLTLAKGETTSPNPATESGFEKDLEKTLQNAGYLVDLQMGCSGFRIDLAVKHPETGDHFLAIECDGPSYHHSKSTRDRDRLRREILEKLGWKCYRIWSADWFKNRQVERDRLLDFVKNALAEANAKKGIGGSTSGLDSGPAPITPNLKPMENGFIELQSGSFHFPAFQAADVQGLYRQYYHAIGFTGFLIKILEVEGPVSIDMLLSQILFLFGGTKVTSRVREEFASHIAVALQRGQFKQKEDFLALKIQDTYPMRVPNEDEEKRNIQDIWIRELAGGMEEIIRQNIEVTQEGLNKTMSNLLGYSRQGSNIQDAYDQTLRYLLRTNRILEESHPNDPEAVPVYTLNPKK